MGIEIHEQTPPRTHLPSLLAVAHQRAAPVTIQAGRDHTLTLGSLFAGIGGFDLGFERAGFTTAWQVENEKSCRSVLERHFNGAERHGDIHDCDANSLGSVDLVAGGVPCQDVSGAGRRKGLAGKRSGLWWEFHRVLGELRPRWVCIENVPGLLSVDEGRGFASVLHGLEELGYRSAWRVLDAQHFGLAQRRKRVFIVGHLGAGSAGEVLFERTGVQGHPAPGRPAGKDVAGTLGSCSAGGGRRTTDLDGCGAYVAGCLQEKDSKGADSSTKPGHLIPFTKKSRAQSSEGFESWDDGLVSPTLNSFDSAASRTTVVIAMRMREGCDGGGKGPLISEGRALTLGTANDQTISVADPITANEGRTYTHEGDTFRLHNVVGGVRRLTPRECERLQGFPDDWTAWGRGISRIKDTNRYRMLGNAVAVPVAEWIARRIVAVDADLSGTAP